MAYVYTVKEFEEISKMYENGQTLEDIQSLFPDKSVASIRMKLVKAGLYNKPATPVKRTNPTEAPKPKASTSKAAYREVFKKAHHSVGDSPL